MISRSPAAARAVPPDTGASTTATRPAARRSAAEMTASGPTVAMTTTMLPAASEPAAPPGANSASSACSGVATMITVRSAPPTAAATVPAGRTPSPARDAARPGTTS